MGSSLVAGTLATLVMLVAAPAAQSISASAKALFYSPGDDRRGGPAGIRYWFENDAGTAFTEARAASTPGQYTLHVRASAAGFISIWDMGRGIELVSRATLSGGHALRRGITLAVPDVVEFTADAPRRRLIIVWGRSRREQAGRAAGAEARHRELIARIGRDGAPQIIRESDDVTPDRVGTYVINREGMALATEVVLRAR